MLLHVDPARLECAPTHFCVESEVPEPRMFGEATVLVHHEMLEVVADGDLVLSVPQEVSGSGGEERGEGTGEVALRRELVDGSSSN